MQSIRPAQETTRHVVQAGLTQDWDESTDQNKTNDPTDPDQDEDQWAVLGDPDQLDKIIITISEGFQAGDNLVLTPDPIDVALRRIRLESTRPLLILEHAVTPDAYRAALKNLKFSHRHSGGDTRRFSLTLSYKTGIQETFVFGEFVPSAASSLPRHRQKTGWLYDDSDFDLFLFNIQETGLTKANFLPEPLETEKAREWSVSFETVPDFDTPIHQPLGLLAPEEVEPLDTSATKDIEDTLQKRLKSLEW